MEREMADGNGAAVRRGAYRRRASRPAAVRARRDALFEIGSLDRLARQTALLILPAVLSASRAGTPSTPLSPRPWRPLAAAARPPWPPG